MCAIAYFGIVPLSPGLHAQVTAVAECNVAAGITIESSSFDPLVRGPLTYEWRDERGLVVGREEALVVVDPGEHTIEEAPSRTIGDRRPHELTGDLSRLSR